MAAVYEYRPDYAVPPGWVLEERLEAQGISQAEFARQCGCSQKMISEIISGKAPLERETASQFERVLGVEANLWLGIETDYRRQLNKKEQLFWSKVLSEKFLQWHQQLVRPRTGHRKIGTRVVVGAFAVAAILLGVYVGNHDQVRSPTFAKDSGQKTDVLLKSEIEDEDAIRKTPDSVVRVSNKAESGGSDNASTFEELRLLAEQGNPKAQFRVGEMFYQGKGYIEAHMWWSLAAGQGLDEASEKRDMVAQQMTSEQIAEAERRAREWKRDRGDSK